jgi:hypothetical protein
MTGKLVKEFAGLKEVGKQVHLQWVIYFPWVPNARKFKGEVIYSIRLCKTGVPGSREAQLARQWPRQRASAAGKSRGDLFLRLTRR